jgi:cytidylate kinase
MTRVITIGREFGSGGAEVARLLAEETGWQLIDRAFIDRVAWRAKVSTLEAERCDERIDSWFHRTVKALWHGGYEGSATSTGGESVIFDSDAMARLARHVIDEAASLGECIIVGRGAQCILQRRKGIFHVFVYGPWHERIQRIHRRLGPDSDAETVILNTDRAREGYIRRHFSQDWTDRHLYHLQINSCVGLERAARAIACAAGIQANHA